jgi:hypothetical protein
MMFRIGLIAFSLFALTAPTVLAGGGLIELRGTYPGGSNIASPGQTVAISAKVHLTNDKAFDDPDNLCKQCKTELKIIDQIADTQISQESDKTNDNGEIFGHVRVNNQHIVYFVAEAHLPNGQSYTSYSYVLDFDGPIQASQPSLLPSSKPIISLKPSIKPTPSIASSPTASASNKISPTPPVIDSPSAEISPVTDFIQGLKLWFKSIFSFWK